MATKNIVPRTGSEGEVGTSAKPWSKAHIDELTSSIGVSASYFYGDGSSLTGIATGTSTLDEVTTAGNTTANSIELTSLTASANVVAASFFGDGSGLTNLSTTTPTIEDVLTAGNVATTPFTGSGIRVDDIGNTTLSITANSGDLNLSSSANVNLDLAGGDFKVEGGRMTVGTSGVPVDLFLKGDFNINKLDAVATLPIVSSSIGVSGAFFQGDGSGLTNLPAASWDGQLNGDAGITGSLDVSGSSEFGNLSTDTHQFTGSVNISGALYAGTENPEEDHQIIGTLLVDAAGTNNSELIVDGPNPNFIKLNRNSSTTGMFSTDGSRLTLYGGTAGFAAQIYDGSGDDRGIIDLARSNGLVTGTKHKLNISASTNALRVDTNSGNSVFTVKDDTTGLIHLSASGQIYGNGYDNGQKTANFTIDWNNGSNQIVSVSGAAATGLTASFSNIKPWSTYQFIYQVDKTNMELYLDHSIFWPGGTRPSLSNVSGSRDIVTFTTDGDSNMNAVAQFNFSASVG